MPTASPGVPIDPNHSDCIGRMRAMQSQSVDFILTDPPYVARYRSRDGRKIANDDNADWLCPAFAEMYRVLKYRSFCVSFYGWPICGFRRMRTVIPIDCGR
jgi:DNA modification methylase